MSPINSGTNVYGEPQGSWLWLPGGRDAAIERMLDEWDRGKAVPMGAKKRAEKRFLCARLLDAAAGEKP